MSSLLIFGIIVVIVISLILAITYIINPPTNDYEKHSAYECGFEPFGDARSFFDIHFYTIGLLFIIFDLEVVFLIPSVVEISNISLVGYINFIIFILIVLIGFYYEWAIGLLNWIPEKSATNWGNHINSMILLINSDQLPLGLYIQPEYLIFLILITFSLLLNQLNNLIYRVVNLAGLSLLVVGTWVYFTDVIFLYIVYILAFVGAVVMLFLSVILMLPASVTTSNNTSINYMYVIVTEIVCINSGLDYYNNIVIFVIMYTLCWIILTLASDNSIDFTNIFRHIRYTNSSLTGRVVLGLASKTICKVYKYISGLFGINTSPSVYIKYTESIVKNTPTPRNIKIGMFMHDLLFFMYLFIESQLYGPISKDMYNNTQPVWNNVFKVLEYAYSPARSGSYKNWPIKNSKQRYIPAQLKYSFFRLFPYMTDVNFFKYQYGNSILKITTNRLIFILNMVYFFIFHFYYNIVEYLINLPSLSEMILQICLTFSIFMVANPFSFTSFSIQWNNSIMSNSIYSIDSLIAIKEILYESDILYLLISVIGLLIALIGSAIFTRHSNNS